VRIAALLVAAVLVLAACSEESASTTRVDAPIGPGTTTPTTIPVPAPVGSDAQLLGLGAIEVVRGFERPSFAIAPWGDDRLFVLEQRGVVSIVRNGVVDPDPFLDISDRVGSSGLEQGLLGMAFHPAFPGDPRVFVYYTDLNGDSVLASFDVSSDPDRLDEVTSVEVLAAAQPASNHNGGMVAFGPDGYLYLGLGDGGGANDQFGNGRRPDTVLGTILRIDVDGAAPYAVPPDNPFVAGGGAAEVWAYGLRNPWRFDVDPTDGRVYIADVGQGQWEEVSVVSAAGADLGWSVLEGVECFSEDPCDASGTTEPLVVYGHDEGCSVTGGFVYRGAAIPELTGHYLYSDWCGGWLRSFRAESGAAVDEQDWTEGIGDIGRVSSFGRDGNGELYLVTSDGVIWKIVPER
jgi:glucose/arabinose dehydrogenase